MNEYYSKQPQHRVAADCIIFGFDEGELKVLLIKRRFEPLLGKWSLIGGFLKEGESLDQAALRVLINLTGLQNIYMKQFKAFGDPKRDPEARVISIAYYALIKVDPVKMKISPNYDAAWFSIKNMPELIFDHEEMVKEALNVIQEQAKARPIGFELLPEKFTIPQLQLLYESIYQKQFDRRNFSKKLLSTGLLTRLEEKQKGFSRKGAFFYEFNKNNYKKLLKQGYNLEFL